MLKLVHKTSARIATQFVISSCDGQLGLSRGGLMLAVKQVTVRGWTSGGTEADNQSNSLRRCDTCIPTYVTFQK